MLKSWCKGRRPLDAVLYSLRGPSELSQWLCNDENALNIVLIIVLIIIIIIIIIIVRSALTRRECL